MVPTAEALAMLDNEYHGRGRRPSASGSQSHRSTGGGAALDDDEVSISGASFHTCASFADSLSRQPSPRRMLAEAQNGALSKSFSYEGSEPLDGPLGAKWAAALGRPLTSADVSSSASLAALQRQLSSSSSGAGGRAGHQSGGGPGVGGTSMRKAGGMPLRASIPTIEEDEAAERWMMMRGGSSSAGMGGTGAASASSWWSSLVDSWHRGTGAAVSSLAGPFTLHGTNRATASSSEGVSLLQLGGLRSDDGDGPEALAAASATSDTGALSDQRAQLASPTSLSFRPGDEGDGLLLLRGGGKAEPSASAGSFSFHPAGREGPSCCGCCVVM